MLVYILKRLLAFIPSLLVLAVISFLLLKYSPGDPVEMMLTTQTDLHESENNIDKKTIAEVRHQLGLDLPVFYISISDQNKLFPSIKFHGENQFQRWLFGTSETSGLIHGDFGNSFQTNESVLSIIKKKVGWSLLLSLLSILISFLIVVPIGLRLGRKEETSVEKRTTFFFNILYALPSFWIAILLLFFLSNPDMLNLFPVSGVSPAGGFGQNVGIIERIFKTIPYLILPLITFTYSSFAFISGSVKVSIQSILKQDFIRTAKAKGLSEKNIADKHALPNVFPLLITIFSHVFPFIIGGSVILETIFNIPGMGNTIFQAISMQDFPVVIAVFFFTGFITMTGFLISDLLYAIVDPRIKFTAK